MLAGDDRFDDWMKAHLGVLLRIARAFADPADQPDLLQELMLAVWKAEPAFRGDSAPVTFIYRVAHNRAMTWRRRESGRIRRAGEMHGAWSSLMVADGDPAVALLDRLYAAIRRLDRLDRSLMLLALDGAPYSEMAQLHELSETNVGARLTRARARISRLVEEDGDGF